MMVIVAIIIYINYLLYLKFYLKHFIFMLFYLSKQQYTVYSIADIL